MATPIVLGQDYIYLDDDGLLKFKNDDGSGGLSISDAAEDLAQVTTQLNLLLARMRKVGLIDP